MASPRKISLREADIRRAIKGARSGGMEVGQIEVDPRTGVIIVHALEQRKEAEASTCKQSHYETWMAGRHAR